VSRWNTHNLVPGAGLNAMREWRRLHPERWLMLMREGVRHSWQTNPERRAHLARVRRIGTANSKRQIDWDRIRELRAAGLSWRRIKAVTGIPHSTLITRWRALCG
jgi:hypothetical protein